MQIHNAFLRARMSLATVYSSITTTEPFKDLALTLVRQARRCVAILDPDRQFAVSLSDYEIMAHRVNAAVNELVVLNGEDMGPHELPEEPSKMASEAAHASAQITAILRESEAALEHIKKQSNELTALMEQANIRAEAAVTQIRGEMLQAVDRQQSALVDTQRQSLEKLKEETLSFAETAIAPARERLEASANAADAEIESLRRKKDEFETLFGVVTDKATSTGFLNAAQSTATLLDRWRVFTICAFVVWIGLSWWTLHELVSKPADFTWPVFAARTLLLLSAGLFVFYLSRQSDRYYETERRQRQIALDLESVRSFSERLQPREREQFLARFGDRTFGLPFEARGDLGKQCLEYIQSKEGKALLEALQTVLAQKK